MDPRLSTIPRSLKDSQLISKARESGSSFEIIDNYELEQESQEWIKLLREKKFNFRVYRGQKQTDAETKELYMTIKRRVFIGLDTLSKPGRVAAW